MWNILRISVVAVAVTLILSGCVPTAPVRSVVPKPTSTPIFASDDEALAAATKAYAAYTNALDVAFSTWDTSKLEGVASGQALLVAKRSVAKYEKLGKHQKGLTRVDDVSLVDPHAVTSVPAAAGLQIYACLDLTRVDVVDASGKSVVPAEDARRFPIIASLSVKPQSILRVDRDEIWNGQSFC